MSAPISPSPTPASDSPAKEPRPGVYRHYKGPEYLVFNVARHSETEDEFVVYRQLYGDGAWWIRPRAMFLEYVEHSGQRLPRFTFVAPAPASG